MGKGLIIALTTLGVVSFLPVFRGGGHSRHDGISFWELLHDSIEQTHLPYDEAVRLAHEAWLQQGEE